MGKAMKAYQRAVPGSSWTTDKIIKLAQAMRDESVDISDYMYGLVMLATGEDQATEVNMLLAAMVESEAERKGSKVEVAENPTVL